MDAYEQFVRLIQQGDPVSPGTANRPIRDLQGNISYLWKLLNSAGTGGTLFARRVAVEPGALIGMPVYWNPATQQFERGLALVQAQANTGVLMTAPSAQVWGVVFTKADSTTADIVLWGFVPLDISQAVAVPVTAGIYYLSGVTPGMLVQQKPPVSVMVLRTDGQGNVLVTPQFVDFLSQHVHYQFALTCLPAGTTVPPVPGNPHIITNPDPTLPGWLPADDPAFNGNAPTGAVFGYNLAAQPALANIWPPLPTTNAYLEWDRGLDDTIGATGVPLGPNGACIIDRNGIWWMHDCWNDVPWPTSLDTTLGEGSESWSYSESDQCPRHLFMTMTLWFTKLTFMTDQTVVTSLQSGDDRLVITCVDGTPAITGPLVITLDLNLVVETGQPGYQVLKTLTGNTFAQGPVCEGVYALSDNVVLTSPAQGLLVPNDDTSPTVYYGPVGLAVQPETSQEIGPEFIKVNGVDEDYYNGVLYLRFYSGQQSSILARFDVPANTQIPEPQLSIRMRIFGTASGGLPALTVSALIVPRPDGTSDPLAIPTNTSSFSVTINTTASVSAGYYEVEVAATPFAVSAGDLVFFTVQRSSGDSYDGDVGLLQIVCDLTSGG